MFPSRAPPRAELSVFRGRVYESLVPLSPRALDKTTRMSKRASVCPRPSLSFFAFRHPKEGGTSCRDIQERGVGGGVTVTRCREIGNTRKRCEET